MADHGFDGSSASHLAAHNLGGMPGLAADTDFEPIGIVVTAIALVAVDAADGNPCKLFEIGDDETECMTVVRIAVQCPLACSKNWPPFGAVTGVAAELGSVENHLEWMTAVAR